MNNDPMNQPYPQSAPTPRRIEWRAIMAGIAVGFVLSVVWRWMFTLFLGTVGYSRFGGNAQWVFMGINLGCTLAKGTAVGFVAARLALSRPYFHAFVATFLAWLVSFVFSVGLMALTQSSFALSYLLTWQNLLAMFVFNLFSIMSAFYGAYMAQSFKRTRGAQID